MAAKITTDGLWRVSYGEIPGLTPEEAKKDPEKMKQLVTV
jgi:hypothetical protein